MTKIVLCGANGKMGHTLAGCIAKREDCTVIAGIDSYTKQYDSFPIVETAEQLPERRMSSSTFQPVFSGYAVELCVYPSRCIGTGNHWLQ